MAAFWRWYMYQAAVGVDKELIRAHVLTADFKRPYAEALSCTTRAPLPMRVLGKALARYRSGSSELESMYALFDRWTLSQIQKNHPDSRIFHGWSSFCLQAFEKLKGSKVLVVERAGTHIDEQLAIIDQEMQRWGMKASPKDVVSESRRERMLREYELADAILTCSSVARQTFIKHGIPGDKVHFINLGSNFTLHPSTREGRDGFQLICVAMPSLRKGLFYLLEAWKELKLPNAKLHIVTTPNSFFDNYRDIEGVEYHAHMPWEELSKLYESCDAFCLPSVEDGFGMVVSEAMSFEMPVIVTHDVGASDIVTDGEDGFVVESASSEALKRPIETLYRDAELRRAMGTKAGKRASQVSWQKYGADLTQFYLKLA